MENRPKLIRGELSIDATKATSEKEGVLISLSIRPAHTAGMIILRIDDLDYRVNAKSLLCLAGHVKSVWGKP